MPEQPQQPPKRFLGIPIHRLGQAVGVERVATTMESPQQVVAEAPAVPAAPMAPISVETPPPVVTTAIVGESTNILQFPGPGDGSRSRMDTSLPATGNAPEAVVHEEPKPAEAPLVTNPQEEVSAPHAEVTDTPQPAEQPLVNNPPREDENTQSGPNFRTRFFKEHKDNYLTEASGVTHFDREKFEEDVKMAELFAKNPGLAQEIKDAGIELPQAA